MKKNLLAILFLALLAGTPGTQEAPTSNFTKGATPSGNTKLYDFSFVDTEFEAVFQALGITAGIDILPAPDVKGKVTLKVTRKTWQEVLDILCNLHELTWVIEDKYVKIEKTATYQAKQRKQAENKDQAEQVAPLVRKSFQVRHAKASELVTMLDNMKSSRGRITVVERNNAIIVYDTEKRINEMENSLRELDIETLQIVITAKLVVVDSKLARELGVDWTARMGSGGALTPGKAELVQGQVGDSRNQAVIQSFPNQGNSPGVLNPTTTISMSVLDNNLGMAISNILGDGSTEILASPQISTLDHTEARIFMGEQISLRVVDNNGQAATQQVDVGIKLTVTPHVSGDNRILLDLKPENKSYNYDDKGQPVISTQEAETKVVVADGETVVIAGLTKNEDAESESGIPFLKDIPLLGHLFKYSKKTVNKQDLVIFVTPRIMRNHLGDSRAIAEAIQAPVLESPAPKAVPVTETPAPNTSPERATIAPPAAPATTGGEEQENWD